MKKFHIKKGDFVEVISGSSKGTRGKVARVVTNTYRAVVEGANMVSKHQKPSATNPNGGIIQMEAPIHMSNLMLVDAKTDKVTRISRKRNENGQAVRISKKSGEVI
jgi:large subunit ribosomal protein L24